MTGQYTNFTYDPEGGVTSYIGFYAPGDTTGNYPKMLAKYGYSARGELVDLHHQNSGSSQTNLAWPHYDMKAANGFMVPQAEASSTPSPTYTFDAIDDFVQSKVQSTNGSTKSYTRDMIGRQTGGTLSGGSLSGNYSRTYDIEDHLLTQAFTTYTTPSLRPDCAGNDADDAKYTGTHSYKWGPNGHPIQIDSETLHWDGDTLLYTSNTAGTVDSVKTGLLADSSPPNGENLIYDRDDSGVVVSNHNGTGFSGWTPPDAYGQRCAVGAPPSSSAYASFISSTFGPINAPASDGITDGFNVLQGGHGFDSKTAEWVSADVLAGDDADPQSQKPLMWNRDNAMRFTDPDGMCPQVPTATDPTCVIANVTSHGVAPDTLGNELGDGFGAIVAATGPTPDELWDGLPRLKPHPITRKPSPPTNPCNTKSGCVRGISKPCLSVLNELNALTGKLPEAGPNTDITDVDTSYTSLPDRVAGTRVSPVVRARAQFGGNLLDVINYGMELKQLADLASEIATLRAEANKLCPH